jgi:processive 1,2-diacylglycerol beta-glucosyltransferase
MKPRVLVLSASVGAGHLRAAEAVESALRQTHPEIDVENHDVLGFTNAVFRRVYGTAYLDLVNRAPHLLGYFYDRLDLPSRSGRNRTDRIRLAVEKLNLRRFEQFLTSQHWDLVINTHFLPAELIARLTRDRELAMPQVTVCTDFDTHRMWVNQPCRRYFCATDEGAYYLAHWGVPQQDIEVTGIPIDPRFAEPADRAACLASQGLVGDRPVVLQLCGGFGVGPVEELYRALLEIERPLELVVVCGRNEELTSQLGLIAPPQRHRVRLLGFTREIDQLMGCADVLVSKPGGLTTSEALARGLPMVVANPIPGQESRNSDYLLERGAAIKVNHPALLTLKLSRLLDDPGRLARMRETARSLGHPRAAFDVAERSLGLIPTRSEVEVRPSGVWSESPPDRV